MVYDKSALKHMREAGLRLTEVIYKLREEVVAGITGEELDAIAEKLILSLIPYLHLKAMVVSRHPCVYQWTMSLFMAYLPRDRCCLDN